MAELLLQLQHVCGEANVLFDQDLSAYERDWRGREQGRALCVVRPGSTADVAAVVKEIAALKAALSLSEETVGNLTAEREELMHWASFILSPAAPERERRSDLQPSGRRGCRGGSAQGEL
jgi:hypothetical protein